MSAASGAYSTGQIMLMIQALSPGAGVNYSQYTQQWYVEARHLDIGDGVMLSGGTEHCGTPQQAIQAYFEKLIAVDYPKYIATEYDGQRREWRWNGAAFAECTRREALILASASPGATA